jgi:hypothetical protein
MAEYQARRLAQYRYEHHDPRTNARPNHVRNV